jgi:hypothetical protein
MKTGVTVLPEHIQNRGVDRVVERLAAVKVSIIATSHNVVEPSGEIHDSHSLQTLHHALTRDLSLPWRCAGDDQPWLNEELLVHGVLANRFAYVRNEKIILSGSPANPSAR